MTRRRAKLTSVLFFLVLLGLFLRSDRPWETSTQRAHRLCGECGLDHAEVDQLIDDMLHSTLSREGNLELFYDTFPNRKDSGGRANFRSYAYPCIRFTLIQEFNNRRKWLAVELIHDESSDRNEVDEERNGKQKRTPVEPACNYECRPEDIDAHEATETVRATKAIHLLDDTDKWVLVDHAVEGRTFREMGDLLGVSRARTQQRHKRALETVRAAVKVA